MPFRIVAIRGAAAVVLTGCVVVPARPAYYRPAPVVVY
ncbi:membrane protein [Burkholderia sp. MSh2]|uniref:Membrane protein n=1 Tax=Burkholderia paludis TaxID=1506587 RepID=A0A6J5DDC0_9BURK|nr:membrane protein [Burkholderia sp. MSh2]KFG98382.1 membrane protein [Burkholderia paludis]CAB3751953.1 hypothetical protein LMG30113_01586 [Burkholderia paludis]VWB50650.1 membrane protein [Burkholderia paludis]